MKIDFSFKKRNVFLFFVLLFWFVGKIEFYQYVGFSQANNISKIVTYLSAALYVFYMGDILRIKEHKYVSLIAIEVIVSSFISIVLWDASPYYVVQAQGTSVGLLYVIVFFALRKMNAGKTTVQNVLIALSIIYLLCWAYSLYKIPELVFGVDRDDNYGEMTDRGFYRFFIPGNVSAILSFYFLGIFLYKRKRWGLFLAFGMLLVVILHVGRQMIVWTIIISIIMAFMRYRKKLTYLVLATTVGYIGLMFVAKEIPAVSAMYEMSKDQGNDFENDIRMEASKYFIFDYPHNPITSVLGNGVPTRGTELLKIEQIGAKRGYFQTDVGFIAMYCNYGVLTIILFLLLLIRIVKMKVEPDCLYLKYYIFFVYGAYLMSQALTVNIFTVMMAYYVLEKSAIDLKSRQYSQIKDIDTQDCKWMSK